MTTATDLLDLANKVHSLAPDGEKVFEEDSTDCGDALFTTLAITLVDQSLLRL